MSYSKSVFFIPVWFDNFQALQPFSTVLGLGCVAATMVLCIFWLINRHNKL